MEKKQVGAWRLPAELTECRQGAEIVLVFDNRDEYQGIFRGFDNEEIVLQACGKPIEDRTSARKTLHMVCCRRGQTHRCGDLSERRADDLGGR